MSVASFESLNLTAKFATGANVLILAVGAFQLKGKSKEQSAAQCCGGYGQSGFDSELRGHHAPHRAAQRQPSLKRQDVHGHHSRTHPSGRSRLGDNIQRRQVTQVCQARSGSANGRPNQALHAWQSEQSDGEGEVSPDHYRIEGKASPQQREHSRANQSAHTKAGEHDSVSFSSVSSCNQGKQGPKRADEQ